MSLKSNYPFLAVILVVLQLVICNYIDFGPYVVVSLLPAVVLFMPLRFNSITDMLFAFAMALAVDLLADGVLGLNVAALLPAAYCRRPLIRAMFGEDMLSRESQMSLKKNGHIKVISAVVILDALFLLIYIFFDGAVERPAGFFFARFFASLGANIFTAPFLALSLSDKSND